MVKYIKGTFLVVLMILLQSWREVQILIDRGSWRAEEHLNVFWYTDWQSFWKLWDSFHVSNGLFTLILSYLIVRYVFNVRLQFLGKFNFLIFMVVFWFCWMQLRDLFMGVI